MKSLSSVTKSENVPFIPYSYDNNSHNMLRAIRASMKASVEGKRL